MRHVAPYRMMAAHRTNLAPAVQGSTYTGVGAGYGVVQGTGPCAGDDEGEGMKG